MKKQISLILTVCLLIGSLSVGMTAFAAKADGARRTTVIVEFDGDSVLPAVSAGADVQAAQERVERTQRNAVQEMEKAADGLRVRYIYTQVLNAAAVEVRRADVGALRRTDGVKAVYTIDGMRPARDAAAAGEITSGVMIGLDKAREMGYDGTGTAVAVIDGGFDVDHETMRLTDESTAKYSKADIAAVIASHTMNSKKITADAVYKSAKIPFAFDYYDEDTVLMDAHNSVPEHGTHVSGIAAGNSGKLTGIAPEAQVFLFKIDLYEGDGFLSSMLAAIDDAAKFEIASINISAGLDLEIAEDPTYALLQEAFRNARASGITVCTAAGNGGSLYYEMPITVPDNSVNGIPNSFDGATSVASVDNMYLAGKTNNYPSTILYDGGKRIDVIGNGIIMSPQTTTIVSMGKNKPNEDLMGKTALLYLHQADYKKPINAILDSNAAGVILSETVYMNLNWGVDYMLLYDLAYTLPVMIVSDMDAYRLLHASDRTIEVEYGGYYEEPADMLRVSAYSSWGVADDGSISIAVAAPGGMIASAIPGSGYDVYSGTSMASPHVAGAAALVEQYLTKKAASLTVKERGLLKENLMMSTADPIPQGEAFASVRAAGAGLIDLSRALTANAVLVGDNGRSSLHIGNKLGEEFRFSFAVKNFSAETVRYDSLRLDLFSVGYTENKHFNEKTGTYEIRYTQTNETTPLMNKYTSDMPRSISLQPGESKTITVQVSLDPAQLARFNEVFSNGFFVEGYVTLSDLTDKQTTLNMPLIGFEGDWDAVPAIGYVEDEYWDDSYYCVWRNLRELRYVLTDADGTVAAEESDAFVVKGLTFKKDDVTGRFSDVADGTYTLKLVAVPLGTTEGTEQEYDFGDVLIDRKSPKIISARTRRSADGSGTIELTVREPDLAFVQIDGGSVLNYDFIDVYPLDTYDHIDRNGNYVYVLHEEKLPLGWFVFEAADQAGNTARRGLYSPLCLLFLFLQTVRGDMRGVFWILQRLFGIA